MRPIGDEPGRAGAIRRGIARALLLVDESYRAPLKAARRAPQFSKR